MIPAIHILGGGLAGLSLGIALRKRGIPVAMSEASSYPRHRVCGEFISGVSAETLEMLGIADLLSDAQTCRSTVWFHGDDAIASRLLPEPARGISRHRLDLRMAEAFQRLGGVLRTGVRAEPEELPGEIVAIGRSRRRGEWLGIKTHVADFDLRGDLEMHLGEHCYLGIARIEDGLANLCGLFRGAPSNARDLAGTCRERGLGDLAGRLENADIRVESFSTVAGLGFGWQFRPGSQQRSRSFCLGDSLAMIPPFSGNGMSMAFEGAALAVGPIESYYAGDVSWDEARQAYISSANRAFRRRLLVAKALQPALIGASGQTILSSVAGLPAFPFSALYKLIH